MSRSPDRRQPLLVPVGLEAMCVGAADAERFSRFAPNMAEFAALPCAADDRQTANIADDFVNAPFFPTDDVKPPMETGVHLHWALPDALTHGRMVYQLTGRALNELRLLGVPMGVLKQILSHLTQTHGQHELHENVMELPANSDEVDDSTWIELTLRAAFEPPMFDKPLDFLQGWLIGDVGIEGELVGQYQSEFTQAAGRSRFPAVPNRWLLLRLVSHKSGTALSPLIPEACGSWVIESDFLTETVEDCFADIEEPAEIVELRQARATTVPSPFARNGRPQDGQAPFRYMGRVVPLKHWTEDGSCERYPGLTALGYGEPTFAAYYPNCRNVFGFCDTLHDLGEGFETSELQLSYMVVGWYADGIGDPLQKGHADHRMPASILEEFRWQLPEGASDDLTHILCTGQIQAVNWNPAEDYLSGKTDAEPIEIAIGNTDAEALAAYLTKDAETVEASAGQLTSADILEALQLGVLDRLHQDDGGLAMLENALHTSAFGSENGGTIWTVANPEQQTDQDHPAELFNRHISAGVGKSSYGQVTLPGDVAHELNLLNKLQQDHQHSLDVSKSMRWQLFADWHKYMQLYYQDGGSEKAGTLMRAVAHAQDQIRSRIGELTDSSKAVNEQKKKLLKALTNTPYVIKASAASRFHRPNDPVILLVGDAVQPSLRFGADTLGEAGKQLTCRRHDQIFWSGPLAGELAETVSAWAPSAPPHGPFQQVANSDDNTFVKLLCETLLLDPDLPISESGNDLGDLHRVVRTWQGSGGATAQAAGIEPAVLKAFHGRLPAALSVARWESRGVRHGKNPWHPLLMQWQVHMQPYHGLIADQDEIRSDFVTGIANLDNNHIELTVEDRPSDIEQFQSFKGSAILTPNAMRTLAGQVRRFVAGSSETLPDDVVEVLHAAESLTTPVLSQALGGFCDALIMRNQAMQFAVSDPFDDTADGVAVLVGDMLHAAPRIHGGYNPIRTGLLRVDMLRIVDAFGQIKDLTFDQKDLVVPRSMKAPVSADGDDRGYNVLLAPRLAQPARLAFRFLSAELDDVEMNAHPATSPVCGWVLPNHLDQSLAIYGGDGCAYGSLRAGQADETPVWFAAPGTASSIGDIRNRHLREFAEGLKRYGHDEFDEFSRNIERILWTIEPQTHRQHDSLSVLMGRPLALVRISVSLQTKGLPAYNQNYDAIPDDPSGDFLAAMRSSNGFEKVRFPLRLGDVAVESDGVVGYFVGKDFTDFRIEDSTANLEICLADDPLVVTMLVDPRARIHATTGILPVKAIDVPPDQFAASLDAMELSFLVNPLLGHAEPGKVSLPLPAESDRPWSWIERIPGSYPAVDEQLEAELVWRIDDAPAPGNDRAKMTGNPKRITEGWLKLHPLANASGQPDN